MSARASSDWIERSGATDKLGLGGQVSCRRQWSGLARKIAAPQLGLIDDGRALRRLS
jgi:hypothetical protein